MLSSDSTKSRDEKEFLDGRAGLHELARRHSLSRNLIRLWIRKYEAGEFTDEVAEAVQVAEYERKIAERRCALPRCEEISRHYPELITSSQVHTA